MNIKEKIFPDVKPLAMDEETFFKYQEYGEKRDEKYLQKVTEMLKICKTFYLM